jgi:hypothetical protein
LFFSEKKVNMLVDEMSTSLVLSLVNILTSEVKSTLSTEVDKKIVSSVERGERGTKRDKKNRYAEKEWCAKSDTS